MHGKRTSDTRPGIGNRLFAGAVFGLAATLVASAAWRGTASWRGAWLVQQLARQTRDQRLPPTPGQFVALAKLDPAAIGQLVASAIDAELLAARAARAALQEIFEVVAAELRADSAKRRGAAVGQLAAAAAGFAAQAPRLSEGDRVWGRRCGQQLAELVGEAPPADAAAILADVETVLRATSDPSAGGGAAVIDRTLRMVAAPRVASFGGAGRPSLAAIGAGPMAADIAIADPERVALAAEREEPGEAFEAAADADAGPSDDEALPDQLGEGPPLPQRLLPREQEPEAETAPRQSLDRVSEAPEARPLAPRAAVDGGSGPVSEPQAKLPGAAGPLGSMPAAEAPPTELQLLVVPSPDRLRQLRNRYRQLATSDLNAALSTADRFEATLIREALRARRDGAGAAAPPVAAATRQDEGLDRLDPLPTAAGREQLRTLTDSADAQVRYRALALLAASGDPQLADVASRRLQQDRDPRVIELATRILNAEQR